MRKKEFKKLKIKINLNLKFILILSIIAFICLLSLFLITFTLNNNGAGSEFTDSKENCYSGIYDKNKINTNSSNSSFSTFNEQNQDFILKYKNVKSRSPDKNFILSKLNPNSFSLLNDIDKKILFSEIEYLVSTKKVDSREIFDAILPSYQILLSVLYTDSFAKSIIIKSYKETNASKFFRDFLFFRKEYFPNRKILFELFDFYFKLFKDNFTNYTTTSRILKKHDFVYPKTKDLKYNHRYALDIFFTKVKKIRDSEIGPQIFSFTSGIVVASENNWNGSTTFESYKGGGISPKSGNGVIIYDAIKKRFILYFHLYKTTLKPGDIINSGHIIGYGGNSGLNARKKGHGKHVHIEIYDLSQERFLNCYEIKKLLFNEN